MEYQVLARKWRPKNFSDFVGQHPVVKALSQALKLQRLHHAYLFTGTRGVGKTTLARLFAKCLNCETAISDTPCDQCQNCIDINRNCFIDLIEIDAASRTRVEDTREILENIHYPPNRGRFKIYLIDEVHMLSTHSFNALLKTLEEPPAHVKFLLATTDPERLPMTVLSRCLQFHLKALPPLQIQSQLEKILAAETIAFETTATALLAKAANGSLRDALSLLDQAIVFCDGTISERDVRLMLGSIELPSLFALLTAIAQQNFEQTFSWSEKIAEFNHDFADILNELLSLLHQLSLFLFVPNAVSESLLKQAEFIAVANLFSKEQLQLLYQIALIGLRDLAYAPSQRVGFEMTLLRMLAFELEKPEKVITTSSATNNERSQQLNFQQGASSSANKRSVRENYEPSDNTTENSIAKSAINWERLLNQLSLSGPVMTVASHCVLKSFEDNTFYLSLDPKAKALHNPLQEQAIKEALSAHFNKDVRVVISIEQVNTVTPSQLKTEQASKAQQEALQNMQTDPFVQQMMSKFGATIVSDSVQPLKEVD